MNKFYAGIGSRKLDKSSLVLCHATAAYLAQEGWTLVTGAAEGADQAFAEGALSVGGQVILVIPWVRYNEAWVRSARSRGAKLRILKDGDATAFASVDALHPAPKRLTKGVRALHARNYLVVHKAVLVMAMPAKDKPLGGTGQGIRVAQSLGVKVLRMDDPKVEKRVRDKLRAHAMQQEALVDALKSK